MSKARGKRCGPLYVHGVSTKVPGLGENDLRSVKDEVAALRAERRRLREESERPGGPWRRLRRRGLRERDARLRREILALLAVLPAEELAAENIARFCADVCADGRLGELEVSREPRPRSPFRYRISHRGCEPSFVEIEPRPLEELREGEGYVPVCEGYAVWSRGPKVLLVDDDPEGPTDWHTAVEWVRSDLLSASYGPGNPHPAYLRERKELASARGSDAALLERKLVREGELGPDGRRHQYAKTIDNPRLRDIHDDRGPADVYVPSAEGEIPWFEGSGSPRERRRKQELLERLKIPSGV